ncbi:PREDICTED: uncharacterized protein LOC105361296 [Ceratosolen solmsi marchali]|uniref:Uncharacterized protein LOC105361296 n=1 Tax=Ceratosolen solmsi marchali TaxID=326594 RepID=A0AAJ6YEU1_9HYME|nr:PREDICTED: uncharacterized protein LOC105361296 [Ceratosolen solmsi marchali]
MSPLYRSLMNSDDSLRRLRATQNRTFSTDAPTSGIPEHYIDLHDVTTKNSYTAKTRSKSVHMQDTGGHSFELSRIVTRAAFTCTNVPLHENDRDLLTNSVGNAGANA